MRERENGSVSARPPGFRAPRSSSDVGPGLSRLVPTGLLRLLLSVVRLEQVVLEQRRAKTRVELEHGSAQRDAARLRLSVQAASVHVEPDIVLAPVLRGGRNRGG